MNCKVKFDLQVWIYYSTTSVPREVTPSLGGTGFYAILFCVLSGESRDKSVSIFNNESPWLRSSSVDHF